MHTKRLTTTRRPLSAPLALLLASAALFAAAERARADEVVLKSGKVRRGEVVSQDDRFVVLKTHLGTLRIAASEVDEVRREESAGGDGPSTPPAPPAPAARPDPGAETPPRRAGPRIAARPPVQRTEADGEASGSADDAESASAAAGPVADRPAPPAEEDAATREARLRRARAGRVVRRTRRVTEEVAESVRKSAAVATSIGGRALSAVPKGTEVIVFEPPRPFAAVPGAIELGKRTIASMEMAGAASAWLSTVGGQRLAIRLADVKRHVEVTSERSRMRLFEGVGSGDWVRARTKAGTEIQGRLAAIAEDVVTLDTFAEDGAKQKRDVRIDDLVTVDGLLRDRASTAAVTQLVPREFLAVTYWPSGRQVLGRLVEDASGMLAIDTDDDGRADEHVPRDGPLAEVRRVPERLRETTLALRPGNVVRVSYRDDSPDAAVRRTSLGAVEAMTAFALSLRHDEQAEIVPFDGVTELTLIEDDPVEEIRRWNERIPRNSASVEIPVLPGVDAAQVQSLALDEGISTVSDGRRVTHVFVAAPYEREVYGVRIGEPVSQSTRRSSLRFDTKIVPRTNPDEPPQPRQIVSDSIEGLRFIVLADDVGVVTGIEISADDATE